MLLISNHCEMLREVYPRGKGFFAEFTLSEANGLRMTSEWGSA